MRVSKGVCICLTASSIVVSLVDKILWKYYIDLYSIHNSMKLVWKQNFCLTVNYFTSAWKFSQVPASFKSYGFHRFQMQNPSGI